MNEEFEVLKIVTQRLNKANIAYMISGSIAANYYTVPRMTRDIDIVIELKAKDIDGFVELFQNDFYIDKDMVKKEVSSRGAFNLIHNQYVVKLDFIMRKDSEFHTTAFSRKKKVVIGKSPMWFIAAEDLILAKLDWAKESYSETQLRDVRNLSRTVENLDLAYINKWVERLKLSQIYREASNG